MASRAVALNSTNVRNLMEFAWNRMALAITAAFAPERAIEKAARLFATPPRYAHTPRELELAAEIPVIATFKFQPVLRKAPTRTRFVV